MHPSLHRLESWIDTSIPYLLVALLVITAIDIFSPEIAEEHLLEMEIADNFIISLFVIDLAFKYRKARSMPKFIRSNWIDILAVIPFYMIFRFVDEFILTSELVRESQQTVHIAAGIEEEAAKDIKELKSAKAITRSEKMLRELRILGRVPRIAKAAHFFEGPGSHEKNGRPRNRR